MRNLYFLHIPKTSGTSVNKVLEDAYGVENRFTPKTWGMINECENRNDLVKDLYSSKYSFISGHFAWNSKVTRDRFVFSMFRNPVHRTISQLQHIYKCHPYYVWSENEYDFSNGLLTSIFIPHLAKYISNVQTKYLLSDVDLFDSMQDREVNIFFFFDQDKRVQASVEIFPLLVYLKIVFKLLSLDSFGIQDMHDESLILLRDKLDIPLKLIDEKRTLSVIPSDEYKVNAMEKKQLEKMNKYDIFLYSIAKKVFIYRWIRFVNRRLGIKITIKEYLKNRDKYLSQLS